MLKNNDEKQKEKNFGYSKSFALHATTLREVNEPKDKFVSFIFYHLFHLLKNFEIYEWLLFNKIKDI